MKAYDTDLRGKLCISLCGHDKGKIYVITDCDESTVCLADGEKRTVAQPKKKNRRHIQPILHLPDEVKEALAVHTDLNVKRALKLYKQAEV